MICAACRVTRDPSDLLVVWSVGQPGVRRFVCRPTRALPGSSIPCFSRAVGPMTLEAIALAVEPRPVKAEPILPFTPAWFGLMREAGVRAA